MSSRQRHLYDSVWRSARDRLPSEERIRYQVWRPHLRSPIADVGAGDALLAKTFPQLDVLSIDISMVGVRNAAGHAMVAVAEALPARDGRFLTVILSEVLEHTDNPEQVLAECRRVLASGGVFLLSTPLWPIARAESLYFWLRFRTRPTLANLDVWDKLHERRYSLDDLSAQVRRAGFIIEEIHPLFGSASTLVLYVVEPLLAKLGAGRPRLAHLVTGIDRVIRPLDHSSNVALVCRSDDKISP